MLYSSLDERGDVQIEIDGTPIGLKFAETKNIRSEFKKFIEGSEERKSENIARDINLVELMNMDQDTIKAEFTLKIQDALKKFTGNSKFRFPWKKIQREKSFEFNGSRWMMSPYRADFEHRNGWTTIDIKIFLLSDTTFYDAKLEPVRLGDYIYDPS
jgi:hypothetical protein